MAYLCRSLESYSPDVRIDILVFNHHNVDVFSDQYTTVEDLCGQYGLQLRNTYIRKEAFRGMGEREKWRRIRQIEQEYDLFINGMIFSLCPGRAKKNLYLCMFPPKPFTAAAKGKGVAARCKALLQHLVFTRSYDEFVIISRYARHWFVRYYGKRLPASILYSPVFEEAAIEGRYQEEKKKNIILSVGRFFVSGHNKKQWEMAALFVENQDRFEDYEYHLAGAVSSSPEDLEYVNKIKKLAEQSSRVILHENCSLDELQELYTKAKIFWHATGLHEAEEDTPEKMEHFGITTVEAMSYGAVPVVINRGGQKEIVAKGRNGFLWNTEEECVKYTRKLILDPNLRRKMAKEAVVASRDFSVEVFHKNFGRILQRIGWQGL